MEPIYTFLIINTISPLFLSPSFFLSFFFPPQENLIDREIFVISPTKQRIGEKRKGRRDRLTRSASARYVRDSTREIHIRASSRFVSDRRA